MSSICDGLNDSLRWDDLRDLVQEQFEEKQIVADPSHHFPSTPQTPGFAGVLGGAPPAWPQGVQNFGGQGLQVPHSPGHREPTLQERFMAQNLQMQKMQQGMGPASPMGNNQLIHQADQMMQNMLSGGNLFGQPSNQGMVAQNRSSAVPSPSHLASPAGRSPMIPGMWPPSSPSVFSEYAHLLGQKGPGMESGAATPRARKELKFGTEARNFEEDAVERLSRRNSNVREVAEGIDPCFSLRSDTNFFANHQRVEPRVVSDVDDFFREQGSGLPDARVPVQNRPIQTVDDYVRNQPAAVSDVDDYIRSQQGVSMERFNFSNVDVQTRARVNESKVVSDVDDYLFPNYPPPRTGTASDIDHNDNYFDQPLGQPHSAAATPSMSRVQSVPDVDAALSALDLLPPAEAQDFDPIDPEQESDQIARDFDILEVAPSQVFDAASTSLHEAAATIPDEWAATKYSENVYEEPAICQQPQTEWQGADVEHHSDEQRASANEDYIGELSSWSTVVNGNIIHDEYEMKPAIPTEVNPMRSSFGNPSNFTSRGEMDAYLHVAETSSDVEPHTADHYQEAEDEVSALIDGCRGLSLADALASPPKTILTQDSDLPIFSSLAGLQASGLNVPMLQADEVDLSCLNSRAGSPSGYYDNDDSNDGEPDEAVEAPEPVDSSEIQESRQGDIGISVIVEMGPAGVLLRVSSYDPDSAAEASGEVRRGDVVVSIDGEDLTGSDVMIQGFNQAIRGPVGSEVRLCLMDPRDMEPRTIKMARTPMGITPVEVFAQRLEALRLSIHGQSYGENAMHLLDQCRNSLRKESDVIPNIAVIGTSGHGKTSLIQSIVSSLNEVVQPPSLIERGSHQILDEVFQDCAPEQQPFTLIDTLPLDQQGSSGAQKTYLRKILKGIYGELETPRPQIDSKKKRSYTPNIHAVALVVDGTLDEMDPNILQTVSEVCREQDNTPLVIAVTKVDKAVTEFRNSTALVNSIARTLPRNCFFPTTAVSEDILSRKLASMAAMAELSLRLRSSAKRHALFGKQEATWQESCDFYM